MDNNNPPRTDWFHDWFNEDYLLAYGARSDEEAETFVANWPIWNETPVAPWCLDLGCGAGRFSRAMAAREMKVVGVDLSRALLSRASQLENVRPSLYYLRADFRAPPLKGGFGLAVSLFTSFGYFGTDEEHLAVLKTTAALIAPGGMIIIDHANRQAVVKERQTTRSRIIGESRIEETWDYPPDFGRVEKSILIESPTGQRRYRESVRLFSVEELEEMMHRAGFIRSTLLWGDYLGGPMTETSPRMIYFGRKRG